MELKELLNSHTIHTINGISEVNYWVVNTLGSGLYYHAKDGECLVIEELLPQAGTSKDVDNWMLAIQLVKESKELVRKLSNKYPKDKLYNPCLIYRNRRWYIRVDSEEMLIRSSQLTDLMKEIQSK